MWINQPSTLQPDHKWHGENVLVDLLSEVHHERTHQSYVDAYFVSGDQVNSRISMLSLSPGWKSKQHHDPIHHIPDSPRFSHACHVQAD